MFLHNFVFTPTDYRTGFRIRKNSQQEVATDAKYGAYKTHATQLRLRHFFQSILDLLYCIQDYSTVVLIYCSNRYPMQSKQTKELDNNLKTDKENVNIIMLLLFHACTVHYHPIENGKCRWLTGV